MNKALTILSMILVPAAATLTALPVRALPAEHYAASSALAEGRWVRVKTGQTGMTLITDAELRKIGFSDPAKVRVYGLGGREVSMGFDASTPDDLPLLPSVRTSKGIVFFATDHFTWKPNASNVKTPYKHTIHRFSDDSYYFLSDRETEGEAAVRQAATRPGGSSAAESFTERIVYEKELLPAAVGGAQVLGEDFRTTRSQTFNFPLPGAADDKATANVRFVAKTTNGASSLMFKANGEALEATAADRINGTSSSDYAMAVVTAKQIEGLDGSLAFTIDYSPSGTLFTARLDYIEVFYTRRLELTDGELHFYGTYTPDRGISVKGCSETTHIWDVTDPAAPAEVEVSPADGTATFSTTRAGYFEFVAFDPEAVSRTASSAATVANQDIHALETPDMVIITLPEYRRGAERIAALHEETDGFRVHVLDAQAVYNEFSGGKPDTGAFRKLLKMWHDRGESADGHRIGYCLLMGKGLNDNKRLSPEAKNAGFSPLPIWETFGKESSGALTEQGLYCNDDYIGMLDDCPEKSFKMEEATMHVAVGRLPVTSATQADQMAAKIENYVKRPNYGPWRNKLMIIADDGDNNDHFKQAQEVYASMRSRGNGKSFVYDRVYLDSYKRVMTSVGATYPQATARMKQNYDDGVIYTDYIGHGSPTGWGHEHLWEWQDIISMTNRNLTFMFAATCSFQTWDNTSPCGAEYIMLNPESGIIGMMGGTRKVYIYDNGLLNTNLHRRLFERDADGRALRFGDVYIRGLMDRRIINNLCYGFMGDPAIRVPSPDHDVVIETINGQDLSAGAMPELTAQSAATVTGTIRKADGTLAEDFNGTVTLSLYDSERVITTYGQGGGDAVSYNDRDRRLSESNAKVAAGRFSGVLRVPPEIQGIYTPALISSYAWSDAGKEANGACESLYVFGINEEVTDTVGPKIEKFYVNSPNFENGGLVNSSPVVFARLSDESGINTSESGIGHGLTLAVDGGDIHSDLNAYFTLDPEDPDSGTLAYPLSDIAPGRHTLTLSVWDNSNNVSKATLDINVGAAVDPVIYDITASTSPTQVDFRISLDRPNTTLDCTIGVYDLSGRRIWSVDEALDSDMDSNITATWDLRDASGARVPRGIYIYRATVQTPEGTYSSKSRKIAISAEQKAE